MNENRAKIRLKIGQLEVEYEGSDSFLKEDIFHMMEKMIGFHAEHRAVLPADLQANTEDEGAMVGDPELNISTSTIATRLSVNSGPELAIAAAAYLTIVQKEPKFSREQIHNKMKDASNHYKKSMLGNLTSILQRLVKENRLNELSDGHYALSATEKKKMEKSLPENI